MLKILYGKSVAELRSDFFSVELDPQICFNINSAHSHRRIESGTVCQYPSNSWNVIFWRLRRADYLCIKIVSVQCSSPYTRHFGIPKNLSSTFAAHTEEGSNPFNTRCPLPFAAHAERGWKLMIPTSENWSLLIVILSSWGEFSVENLGGGNKFSDLLRASAKRRREGK